MTGVRNLYLQSMSAEFALFVEAMASLELKIWAPSRLGKCTLHGHCRRPQRGKDAPLWPPWLFLNQY